MFPKLGTGSELGGELLFGKVCNKCFIGKVMDSQPEKWMFVSNTSYSWNLEYKVPHKFKLEVVVMYS